jgi:hypothetical protein
MTGAEKLIEDACFDATLRPTASEKLFRHYFITGAWMVNGFMFLGQNVLTGQHIVVRRG